MTKSMKSFLATMSVLLTVIVALVVLNLSDIGKQKTWDVELPMANANVTWQQTHFPGAWRQE